jgi:ribosomal protein L37AE/L43A
MRTIKPVYIRAKKAYFCPVCENNITRRSKQHFLCNVKFDWTGTKVIGQKIDVFDSLRIKSMKTEAIAEGTSYTFKHTQHVLGGLIGMNPAIRDYLIEHIEDQITSLRNLRNRLLEMQKNGE